MAALLIEAQAFSSLWDTPPIAIPSLHHDYQIPKRIKMSLLLLEVFLALEDLRQRQNFQQLLAGV